MYYQDIGSFASSNLPCINCKKKWKITCIQTAVFWIYCVYMVNGTKLLELDKVARIFCCKV